MPSSPSSSAVPVRTSIINDYDNDDHSSEAVGDGDDDDGGKPTDRDGDSDNSSHSYYDSDDAGVRDFGRAASVADRQAVAALVKRYFAAAAAEDGATACSLVVAGVARSVPEDLGRPPGPPYARGNTCAEVVSKIFKANHRQLATFAAKLEVSAVRVKGDRGLVVLSFRTLPGRQIGVVRESGSWRVAVLLDTELP